MRQFSLFCLLVFIFFSCATETEKPQETATVNNPEDLAKAAEEGNSEVVYELTRADYIDRAKLYDTVMTLHSDLMPLMTRYNKLRSQLARYTNEANAEKLTASKSSQLSEQLKKLELVHQTKLEWMNQFDRNYEQKPHAEAMAYLTDKRSQIEEIRKNLLHVMDQAENMLKEVE